MFYLQSSNGVYVGLKRIAPNIPHYLQESDIIGFGWTIGAPLVNINDNEKYIFKLTKQTPLSERILFQDENDIEDIVASVVSSDDQDKKPEINASPVLNPKPRLKRKLSEANVQKGLDNIITNKVEEVINLISDSDIEISTKREAAKKIKLENISEELAVHIKSENDDLQFEAFNVKQEYLGYDDEAIPIDSDSDSESEHWFLRLSQSSPGKPFTKITSNKQNDTSNDCSYSQADDFIMLDLTKEDIESEEEFVDDLITIPPLPTEIEKDEATKSVKEDIISENKCSSLSLLTPSLTTINLHKSINVDEVDGDNLNTKELNSAIIGKSLQDSKDRDIERKIQVIEPLVYHKKKTKTPMQKSKYTYLNILIICKLTD